MMRGPLNGVPLKSKWVLVKRGFTVGSHDLDFQTFNSGLKSQNHCLFSFQNALWKFKSPRVRKKVLSMSFWMPTVPPWWLFQDWWRGRVWVKRPRRRRWGWLGAFQRRWEWRLGQKGDFSRLMTRPSLGDEGLPWSAPAKRVLSPTGTLSFSCQQF